MPHRSDAQASAQELQHEISTLRQRVAELENALATSETKLQTIMDHAPVGIYLDDVDGNATFVNAKCAKLVGIPAEFAGGFGWTSSLHPDDRDRMVAAWKHAYETSSEFRLEYRWLHADGTIVWTLGEVVPVLGDDGKATMFIGTLTDITARKQVETQLISSVAERETLLHELHHRTRNNLQVVNSIIHLRAMSESQPDTIDRLTEIEHRVASISIANDLLDASESRSSVNLRHYLEELLAYMTPAVDRLAQDISMTASLADIETAVDVAVPLGIAATELVLNASKHAFHGQSSGTIEVALVSSHEERATLHVRDNGTGFPEDFDLKSTLTPGLGTVRMLIEDQLNGQIMARNADGGIVSIDFNPRSGSTRQLS